MSNMRLFFSLLKWDILREVRRKETVLNMALFAILILFLVKVGLGPGAAPGSSHARVLAAVAPVVFWVTILFSGTVGLSQSLVVEREGARLAGLQMAPFDLGIFYLAKVAATWVYVILMELLVLAMYSMLFRFERWDLLGNLLVVLSLFTLGYIGLGVVLAAMTSALRGGGEIVLRVLLLPLMIPVLYLTLLVSENTMGVRIAGGALGDPLPLAQYVAIVGAFDAIYLTTGFLVFPKVIEE